MVVTSKGNVEAVKKLKEKEIKLQGKQSGKPGYTALMYAVEANQSECAKELLDEAGMQNESGDTALMLAIGQKNCTMIEMLAPLEK